MNGVVFIYIRHSAFLIPPVCNCIQRQCYVNQRPLISSKRPCVGLLDIIVIVCPVFK